MKLFAVIAVVVGISRWLWLRSHCDDCGATGDVKWCQSARWPDYGYGAYLCPACRKNLS